MLRLRPPLSCRKSPGDVKERIMKNEPKDQESFFDEIMDRINAIQQDQMIEESRKFIE